MKLATAPRIELETADEIIERVDGMLPAIAARALQAERNRRVPEETIAEIKEAGLNRVMQAVSWGGYGLDFDTYFEVCWRLASACGSTGWVYSQSAVQNWLMGHASHAAQADYYSQVDVLSCSAFNPRGAKVESVEGGWMLSGRWQFSSGCFHADWALLGAVAPGLSGPVLLMVPRRDFVIEDTWHVSGLRATGSNDIVIEEPVFVPGHRYVATGQRPQGGAAGRNGSYGAPVPSISPWGIVTPVVGMAQGALNAFEAATRTRLSAFGDKPVAQMVGPQLRIAQASALIDGARALARSNIREVIDRGAAGAPFSDELRVRLRRDQAFVVNQCYEATMLIARGAGAQSLFETNPIQRFLRDVHAGAMQAAANWDEQAESYGRVRMGLDPNGAMW